MWRGIQLHFTNDWSLWVILVSALALTLVCLVWTRRALGVVEPRWAWIFFALKWGSLLLLIGFLVNPVLSYRSVIKRRGGIAVMVDTSRSMRVRDSLGGVSRFEASRQFLLESEVDFLAKLQKNADPYYYTFDVTAAPSISERLNVPREPDGVATNLAPSLDVVSHHKANQNLLGLVLFSDGQDNGADDPLPAAANLGVPIYAVGVGKREAGASRLDRRLTAARANPIAVRHAEAVARVTIEHDGFAGDVVDLSLSDEDKVIATERVVLGNGGAQEIALTFKPTQNGQRSYKVSIPHIARDAIQENDSLEFSVLVSDARIKLLYIEGTLRWEYKFFKRFLEQDPSIDPSFVIRTGGDTMTIQGMENVTLDGGLPTPLEALAKFDVIIIGDVDKEFLSRTAMGRLQTYVSEKEGGVLFLAGYHTLLSGEFRDSPLDKLLPVTMTMSPTRVPARAVTVRATALGRGHDILVGLDQLIDGRKVGNAYAVGRAKPGATAILEQQEDGRGARTPLLVAQQYGSGRSMVLAADRLWQWDFAVGAGASAAGAAGRSGASRLWGQMTRWLARQEIEGDKEGPLVSAYMDQTYYDPGERVTVNVRANNRAIGKATLNVVCDVFSGERKIATVPMLAIGDGSALRGSLTPPGDGVFSARLRATAGRKESTVDLKFNVGKPFKEMEQLHLNESLLRGLAQQTDGGYYSLVNAEDILSRIRADVTEVERREEVPIVESRLCFILFLSIVFAEWNLRRRKQLI